MTSTIVTNRPKLSATMTPKLVALRFQSSNRRDRRTDEADDAEATERHVLAGRAERLGAHDGQRRQDHAQHRDDGVESSNQLIGQRTVQRSSAWSVCVA